MADTHHVAVDVARYTALALASDSAEANRHFDAYVDLTYDVLTSGQLGKQLPEGQQTRDIAVVHTAMNLGRAVLFGQILRALQLDADDPAAVARLGRAQVFLSTEPLLDSELADRILTSLDSYAEGDRR